MPSGELWFGIITSIANPLGCHLNASWRYPPMVVICGNSRLMALAAQIVLTCRPLSGATPTGSANVKLWAAAGASAVSDFISAGLASRSGAAGGGGGGGRDVDC